MLNKRTTQTAGFFFRAYPRRSAVLVLLLILSGIAEGVGLITLLPLLEVGGVDPTVQSDLAKTVTGVLASLGIDPSFTVLMALIVAGLLLKAAFLWLAARQVGFTVAQVATDLRLSLIRALMAARWSYFASQPAGHLANAIGAEALRASQTYRSTVAVLATAIQALIYFGAALLVSWWVAVIGLLAGGVMLVLFSRWVGMSRDAGDRQTDLTRSLVARLIDALRGIKPIKAMAREHYLWPLLESETHGLNEANRRQVLAGETLRLFQEPLMVLIIAGGLWTVLQVAELNLPTLTVMAFLFYRLTGRFQLLQTEYASMVVGESAFIALRESVDRAIDERETLDVGTRTAPHLAQAVELRDVTFGYTDEPVVQNVSLVIPAGEFVSIVGASGAGKTTILDLLIGLHEPWSGEILVDGSPLAELDRQGWRRRIGYVPQETFLFHDTVARNVTLGDETISRDRVESALRMAGAWDFVSRLQDGMDSYMGEAGGKLSGGQRQRIALARALVADPDILILDEATSALDPDTERAICDTLGRLRGSTTIVSISHQPAMVIAADRIYRLADGRVRDVEIRERAQTAAG